MELYFNDTSIQTDEGISLHQFLFLQELVDAKGIAVAINQKIISRHEWVQTVLNQGDRILVIKATQGG